MPNSFARIFELLLRRLLPARGRHRSAGSLPAAACADAPTLVPPRVPTRGPVPLRGEDVALIRPYLVAHERRREAQRQRARRRVLWLAVHGIDAGPRWIHGVEVAA